MAKNTDLYLGWTSLSLSSSNNAIISYLHIPTITKGVVLLTEPQSLIAAFRRNPIYFDETETIIRISVKQHTEIQLSGAIENYLRVEHLIKKAEYPFRLKDIKPQIVWQREYSKTEDNYEKIYSII